MWWLSCSPLRSHYAVCYQAAMRLGAITSGINPRLGPAEVAGIVQRELSQRPVVAQGGRPSLLWRVVTALPAR